MAYTIREQIVQKVVTAVEGAEGVSEVLRPKTIGIDAVPGHLGVILMVGSDVEHAEHSRMGNPPLVGRRMDVEMDVVLRISDDDETPFDQAADAIAADIAKACMADPQWAGLALDSRMLEPAPVADAEERYEGVTVTCQIDYRHLENDPYSQG